VYEPKGVGQWMNLGKSNRVEPKEAEILGNG